MRFSFRRLSSCADMGVWLPIINARVATHAIVMFLVLMLLLRKVLNANINFLCENVFAFNVKNK